MSLIQVINKDYVSIVDQAVEYCTNCYNEMFEKALCACGYSLDELMKNPERVCITHDYLNMHVSVDNNHIFDIVFKEDFNNHTFEYGVVFTQ